MTKKEAVEKVLELKHIMSFFEENVENIFSLIEEVKKNPSIFEEYSGNSLEKVLQYVRSKIISDKLPALGFFNNDVKNEQNKKNKENEFGDL